MSEGATPIPNAVADARRLTDRIRLLVGSIAEQVDRLQELITEARANHVHATLGFPSWTAYITTVCADAGVGLDRDDRRELVRVLSESGMSTRAIAPVVGVNQATVSRDLSGDANASPGAVVGLDGKTYPSAMADEAIEARERADAQHPWRMLTRARRIVRDVDDFVEDYAGVTYTGDVQDTMRELHRHVTSALGWLGTAIEAGGITDQTLHDWVDGGGHDG